MWAEIAAFCTAKGYTLTVYVDGVTISRAKVTVADVWHVRPMLNRPGLRDHKLKHYVLRPAEITGVVVRDAIGRAHVCTPVPNAKLVCRILLDKTKMYLRLALTKTTQ